MLFVTLLGIAIVLSVYSFYHFCVLPHSYWKRRGILQKNSVWGFGENWKLIMKQESFVETIKRLYEQFPNVRYSGTYQFNSPVLVVRDPELIKQITIKDFEHFADHRSWLPETADPLWSHTLFSLTGEKWREMRTFLSPAFTGRKMRTMFIFIKKAAENLNEYLKTEHKNLSEVDFREVFNYHSCDVIATTAFGIEVDSLKDRNNEFYKLSHEAGKFTLFKSAIFFMSFFVPMNVIKFFRVKFFTEKIRKYFTSLIEENIRTREEQGIIRLDLIHLLMEARKGKHEYDEIEEDDCETKSPNVSSSKLKNTKLEVTIELITAQALIFILGGFETVSVLLRFLAYELAINPDIQNRLRDEIRATAEKFGNDLTYDALMKMEYIDMVVSECLRKWPSGFLVDRVCTKAYTIPPLRPGEKSITLEKGTQIWIPVMGIHYDPEYYPDPDKFNPDRFSDQNEDKVNPYTFLPFGQGPRNCIGNRFAILEAKVMLYNLLREFEIVPVAKSSIPIKFPKTTIALDGDSFIFGLKKLQ